MTINIIGKSDPIVIKCLYNDLWAAIVLLRYQWGSTADIYALTAALIEINSHGTVRAST